MKHLILAAIATGLIGTSALVTSDARAGLQDAIAPNCGTGFCYGTLLAFRNSTNPNDYAEFVTALPATSGSFYASFGGASYTCSTQSNTAMAAAFPVTVSSQSYFVVEWNTSGQCTLIQLVNGSYFGQSF